MNFVGFSARNTDKAKNKFLLEWHETNLTG